MPECAAGLPGCRRQGDIIEYLGVAQFGSVSEWGSEGRRFKSSHPDHRRSRGCIACSDFFCKSHRALTPLRFPFPVARRKKPPCPAARGRRPDCSVFSPFPLEKPLGKKGAAGMSARVPFKKKGLKTGGSRRAGRRRAGRRRTDAQRARQTGGSRRAGAQAGIRSRFPLIPSQEKELKTGGSRGRTRARAGGETGGRTPKRAPVAGGRGAGAGRARGQAVRQAGGPGAAAQVAGRKGCKRAGRRRPPGSCAG